MTKQPKSTAASAAQKAASKPQTLKIKLGEPKIWGPPETPCQILID
jgi:hypothetical protein